MLDDDLWLWAQFLLDTICMVPSIPERASSERICQFATFWMVVALIVVFVKGVFADKKADMFVRVFFAFFGVFMILVGAPVVAMKGWQTIGAFSAPFVVLVRLGEGGALGMRFACLTSPHRRLLALALLGLFLLVCVVGPHITALVKTTWAVLGAGVSAYLWTNGIRNQIREEGGAMYSCGLSLAGFFVIFVAAQFLVSANPFWASLHRWAVPAGALLGGIIFGGQMGSGCNS